MRNMKGFTKKIFIFFIVASLTGAVKATHKHSSYESIDDNSEELLKARQRHGKEKLLTFTATGRDLGSVLSFHNLNPKLSLFYKTDKSDFNSQSTEVIHSSRDPEWATVFKFMWTKGNNQTWQFKVKNVLSSTAEASLGEVVVDVDTFVDGIEKNGQYSVNLPNGHGGLVFKKSESITFKLSATNLAKKDAFGGLSDPYVKCFWSRGPDGTQVEFFRTSWIGNVVDAEWMEGITFDGYQKGTDQYLHFQIYDDDGITSDEFLGEAYLKLDDTLSQPRASKVRILELVNEPKKKKEKGRLIINFIYE